MFDQKPRPSAAHSPGPKWAALLPSLVQRKPTVSSPDDRFEREADEIAERVVHATDPSTAVVQRKCADCDEEGRTKIQTKAVSATNEGGDVPANVMERLGSSTGTPLASATRESMDQAFGFDFSRVRVHTGSEAAHVSRDLHARAFTWGRDIYFGAGEFQPASRDGRKLLAHELAHTVQQGGTRRQIQRWSFGSAPVPNFGYNVRSAPAQDRPRVQAAMDMIQSVVSDRTNHQRCHDQFANTCPGGNPSTLANLVQNMVMWKITDEGALARGTVNGNLMAYTDAGIGGSVRDFAGTILHELGHNCGIPGTSTHWLADRTALYCLGGDTSNSISLSAGPVFGGDPGSAVFLSYRRLLTSLAYGNLRLSAGVDLNIASVGLANLPTTHAEFGSASLRLDSRLGGWGAEGWGGMRFSLGTGPSIGRFRLDPASPTGGTPPGATAPPTALGAGWLVTVGLNAQFYIPTGSAGRVIPTSIDAGYRLVMPINKEAQMLHGLIFGANVYF